MKYCFDSSALIDLGERHYPERLKLFAPIWAHLYQGIDDKEIVSVDYVKIELTRKADEWREAFMARADQMFLINADIETEYGRLITEIEANALLPSNKARDRFMSGADPWVIALTMGIGDCTAVSAETKSLTEYGIGAVCKEIDVRHINLVKFFEENGIGH